MLVFWQPTKMMALSPLGKPLLAPCLHRGETLTTICISYFSGPHGGVSLIWILCEIMQNHLEQSHWLLIAGLTFHAVIGLSYNGSICGERIALFLHTLILTLARMMRICTVHLSFLKLNGLQASTTVLTCFYHGYCSSQSHGPRFLSLIFGQ